MKNLYELAKQFHDGETLLLHGNHEEGRQGARDMRDALQKAYELGYTQSDFIAAVVDYEARSGTE